MALRIRKDGRVLCAAYHPQEPGDLYLDDYVHEYLGWCSDIHADTRQLDNYDKETHEYYIDGRQTIADMTREEVATTTEAIKYIESSIKAAEWVDCDYCETPMPIAVLRTALTALHSGWERTKDRAPTAEDADDFGNIPMLKWVESQWADGNWLVVNGSWKWPIENPDEYPYWKSVTPLPRQTKEAQ